MTACYCGFRFGLIGIGIGEPMVVDTDSAIIARSCKNYARGSAVQHQPRCCWRSADIFGCSKRSALRGLRIWMAVSRSCAWFDKQGRDGWGGIGMIIVRLRDGYLTARLRLRAQSRRKRQRQSGSQSESNLSAARDCVISERIPIGLNLLNGGVVGTPRCRGKRSLTPP